MAFVNNFQDFIKYHAEAAGMTREEFMAVLMSEANKKPGPDPYHRGLDDDEVEDKEDQIKKQAEMDDDDPDAYKEMPGDKEAREKGEVKTSKATKAYNKLYGEDLDEGVMSDIHQMAGEVKSEEEFIKRFFKEYGAKVKKTKDSEEWAKSLYNDMNESLDEKVIKAKDAGNFVKMAKPGRTLKIDDDIYTALGKGKWKGPDGEKLSWIEVSSIASALGNKKVTYESKVNERAAMGYDGYTGLFYFEGVPFTQERLDEVIAWLKDTVIKAAKDLPSQFTYRPAIQIEDEVGGEQVTFDTNKIKYLEYIRKSFKGKLAHDEDFNESVQIIESQAHDEMAYGQLERIIDYATMLRERYDNGFTFDPWMHGKITKAKSYLNSVFDALDGGDGVVETQKMTKKQWKHIKKFNKHITDSGEKFVMSYDDRIGTFLEPVEIVDEALKFGQKRQYSMDDINTEYGFWGTLEIHMDPESIEEIWNDVWGILTKSWKFSDAGALYYLNAKAGRHLADKVYSDINSQISQPDAIDMILSDYAKPSRWKAWSKEYNEFAQEEMMQEAKRGDIHKAAKKGSYPATVVVINSGIVVKQEIVKTPAAVPAVFNELQAQYPDAIISVESKTGETLFSESVVNEEDDKDQKSTDRGPLDDDNIETALKKKAEDTGVPIGIIRAVMRRGLAAWKSGHRPGANQQQWGYARVNAFLTKGEGTWGKADSDLAKEVRDGGHDKKLKKA